MAKKTPKVSDAIILTLDLNTMSRSLIYFEKDRKVSQVCALAVAAADPPDRFIADVPQVLSKEALTGYCSWEWEWDCTGYSAVGVAYKSISRSQPAKDTPKAWLLEREGANVPVYTACHNGHQTRLSPPPAICTRARVRVDCIAGTVSFYWVGPRVLMHVHTFNIPRSDEPLHAVIALRYSLLTLV